MQLALGQMINFLYPPQCAGCAELTDAPHGLCPACWGDASFISGAICDCCGAPIPITVAGRVTICQGCISAPPGWDRGRAALLYEGTGRRVVLSLKHGDRLDLVRPLATWMRRAGQELIDEADIIAPVPLHWSRLLKRRFNQSAELARRIGIDLRAHQIPDLLSRPRPTKAQEGMTREVRFQTQSGAIDVSKRYRQAVRGQNILLIDDVMTSGATLSNCTAALRAAGAETVNVLVAARVAREGFAPI